MGMVFLVIGFLVLIGFWAYNKSAVPSYWQEATASPDELLLQQKVVLIGGLSLIGERGYIVRVVSVVQAVGVENGQAKGLRGWYFFSGHPDKTLEGIQYFDTMRGKLKASPFPNTMTYVVGTVDLSLAEEHTNRRELQRTIDYAMTRIHD